jgi:hypothetical protein
MRAADFLGRLPQAPSRRQSAAPLLLLFNCVTNVTPFPQKSLTLALNLVRGCLPQSLHSPQFSEPDPIYPYLPFLFCSSLWQRPCHQPYWTTSQERIDSFPRFRYLTRNRARTVTLGVSANRTRSIQERLYDRTIIARYHGRASTSWSISSRVL